MKRKMLFMAALAGLVVLGSCVKDDESASVIAIRNAKAAQLNADATLKTAQAAHEQAQAAWRQAMAAHELADANYRAAEAAIKEGASAEEIAKNKADYKKDAANFAAQELGFIQGMARANELALSGYVAAYQTALNNYNVEQAAYIQAKSDLAIAKSDPEAAIKQAAGLIQTEESNIKEQTAYIEALKSTEYSSMTAAELLNAQTAKQNELNEAINKFNSSAEIAALLKASQDFIDARDAYNDLIQEKVTDLNAMSNAYAGLGADVIDGVADPDGIYPKESGTFEDYKTYLYDATVPGIDETYINGGLWPVTYTAGFPYNFDKYSINESVKNAVADAIEVAVTNAKDAYDDDVDLLGTESDTATTTTKRTNNNNSLTLYALLAAAKADLATESDSLTKVQAKYDAEMAKLVQAYKDLAAANALAATETTKAAKTLAAQKAIGESLIKLYGEFTPAIALAADGSNIDAYVFGTSGVTFIATEDYAAIKTRVENNYDDGTRTDDVIDAEYTAQVAVEAAAQVLYDARKQAVADKIDDINNPATGTKTAYDNEVADKKEYEDALAAVDVAAISKAAEDLSGLMDAWDEAKVAVDKAFDTITNINAELTALNAYQATTVDIDQEIADAEASISASKERIEDLKAANSADTVIAQLEQDLAEQEGKLYMAAANLAAAKASLEAILESMGLDPNTEDEAEGGEG